MMYLISGQPGNGKSLRAMHQMREEYERNKQAHADGKEELRRFFTNIAGATMEENLNAFPWIEKLPDHNDWTQLPNGSFVVYDEAHSDGNTPGLERYGNLFPSTGKPGESSDMRIRAMSTHRHRGFDLVFLTQWPNKIHHQVRTLMGSHVHMNRGMGLEAAGVLAWTRVQADPYDEKAREKCEEEIWRYPKDLYGKYTSATLHTASHKFRIPKKVWAGVSKLVVTLLVLWGLYHFMVPDKKEKPEEGPAQRGASLLAPAPASPASSDPVLSPGMGQYASIATAAAPTLAGCVSSDRGCRCFNVEGFQIDMSQHECKSLLANPLPFNVYHEYVQGSGFTTTPNDVKSMPPSTVVEYSPGSRGDIFPRNPASAVDSYTPATTSM